MGWLFAFLILLAAGVAIGVLVHSRERLAVERATLQVERDKLAAEVQQLRTRFKGVISADAEKARVLAQAKAIGDKFNAQLAEAKAKYATYKTQREAELRMLDAQLGPLRAEHKALSDEVAVADMGFFKSEYGFATSQKYKQTIEANWKRQKAMLTEKKAAKCYRESTVDGSVTEGKKQAEKTLAIMLRAFNGDCDAAIAKAKATNFKQMEARIEKAFESINKMGSMNGCEISPDYLKLKIEELRLEVEHAQKIAAEREEQRAIREEMRQQAAAQKEWERAQSEAEREEEKFEAALEKAKRDAESASAAKQEEMRARVAELEAMLAEAHEKKERALSMAQQTRAGVVYVISNIGSFGTNVYKIGMTRRQDPMDRIWELSDASVPFDFDVHAIIRTDDAPALEGELHQRFAERRVNVVNERKEFFHVTIHEIAAVVRERCGDIELTLAAEAAEFLQSEAYRRENGNGIAAPRLFAAEATSSPSPA
jgi:hypothetical protein